MIPYSPARLIRAIITLTDQSRVVDNRPSLEVIEQVPHAVNLDALIRREDFEVAVDPSKKIEALDTADKLKIIELEHDSLMYKLLRKPDFQRTTAHWKPEKVAALIKSFLAGDLIPALILWRSNASGNIFVIDGAHRLSALIAWVHDDYGDRDISTRFFEGNVVPEQKAAAEDTRKITNNLVGSYTEVKHTPNPTPERAKYVSTLAAGGVTLQWVKGDASSAERSFHTINTEQTPIGELEVRLIRDRRCPNAISTRALVRAGTGQYFASSLAEDNKARIRAIAKEIYDDLFIRPLETPIKTLDLPVAGRSYTSDSVELILDFVEFVNKRAVSIDGLSPSTARRRGQKNDILVPTMNEDVDGSATVELLTNVRRVSSRIAGTSPGSLGLHPAVYFYSATGNYQPTAFLAAISFIEDLIKRQKLDLFTEYRYTFEELLLKYKYFINQIGRKYGSGTRGLTALTRLYEYLFTGVVAGKTDVEIVPELLEDARLKFLVPIVDHDKGTKKNFTTERKSAIFLRQAIEGAPRCGICEARVHKGSITIDHIKRISDGGKGSINNGQIAHPYCNTTYKEQEHAATSQAQIDG